MDKHGSYDTLEAWQHSDKGLDNITKQLMEQIANRLIAARSCALSFDGVPGSARPSMLSAL